MVKVYFLTDIVNLSLGNNIDKFYKLSNIELDPSENLVTQFCQAKSDGLVRELDSDERDLVFNKNRFQVAFSDKLPIAKEIKVYSRLKKVTNIIGVMSYNDLINMTEITYYSNAPIEGSTGEYDSVSNFSPSEKALINEEELIRSKILELLDEKDTVDIVKITFMRFIGLMLDNSYSLSIKNSNIYSSLRQEAKLMLDDESKNNTVHSVKLPAWFICDRLGVSQHYKDSSGIIRNGVYLTSPALDNIKDFIGKDYSKQVRKLPYSPIMQLDEYLQGLAYSIVLDELGLLFYADISKINTALIVCLGFIGSTGNLSVILRSSVPIYRTRAESDLPNNQLVCIQLARFKYIEYTKFELIYSLELPKDDQNISNTISQQEITGIDVDDCYDEKLDSIMTNISSYNTTIKELSEPTKLSILAENYKFNNRQTKSAFKDYALFNGIHFSDTSRYDFDFNKLGSSQEGLFNELKNLIELLVLSVVADTRIVNIKEYSASATTLYVFVECKLSNSEEILKTVLLACKQKLSLAKSSVIIKEIFSEIRGTKLLAFTYKNSFMTDYTLFKTLSNPDFKKAYDTPSSEQKILISLGCIKDYSPKIINLLTTTIMLDIQDTDKLCHVLDIIQSQIIGLFKQQTTIYRYSQSKLSNLEHISIVDLTEFTPEFLDTVEYYSIFILPSTFISKINQSNYPNIGFIYIKDNVSSRLKATKSNSNILAVTDKKCLPSDLLITEPISTASMLSQLEHKQNQYRITMF